MGDSGRATRLEMGAYASMNFGYTVLTMAVSTFAMYFLTDVAYLAPGTVAVLLLVIRVFEGVSDPVLGYYMDARVTRFGRFRGYILYWTVPMCLAHILLFTQPPLGPTGLVVWYYAVYLTWCLAFGLVEGAALSMLVTLSADPGQRNTVNTFKVVGGVLATLAVNYLTVSMVTGLGGGDESRGYFLTMSVMALVSLVCTLPGGLLAKEHNNTAQNNRISPRELLLQLGRNKKLMFMLCMYMFHQVGSLLKRQVTTYYMKYYVDRLEMTGVFLVSGTLAALAAQPFIWLAARRVRPIRLIGLGLLGSGAAMVLMGFAERSMALLLCANIFYGVCSAFPSNLVFVYAADIADDFAHRQGTSFSGIIFAMLGMFARIASVIGSLAASLPLYLSNYIPNVHQSGNSLAAIRLVFVVFTASSYGIAALLALCSSRVYSPDERGAKA